MRSTQVRVTTLLYGTIPVFIVTCLISSSKATKIIVSWVKFIRFKSSIISILYIFYVKGDAGYGLEPWLFPPIVTCADGVDEFFNKIHKTTRFVVERIIGQWKCTFRYYLVHYNSLCLERYCFLVISDVFG